MKAAPLMKRDEGKNNFRALRKRHYGRRGKGNES